MLTKEMNERLCLTGKGTPMGEVFRRYWIPAVLSEELPGNDCPPVRVRLLGEDLVAFRDSEGKVGLVDAYCPHRLAPMFYGRNEECGLRCVYHGWKFDVSGKCVDMPNEPAESNFKHKIKIKSYPTYEKGNVVWTYMGPADEQPPYPDYEWLRAPKTHFFISKTFEEANWTQALEGGIDTSHSSFTHNNNIQDKNSLRNRDTAPKLEVVKTDYGFIYAGIRDMKDNRNYVRAYQFIMPAHQMRGQLVSWTTDEEYEIPFVSGRLWVPVDDENCFVYNIMFSADPERPLTEEFILKEEYAFGRGPDDLLPGYRPKANPRNDYFIDREEQRTKTFTGIKGINTQDFALQENMRKPYPDRSQEHLGTTDLAIIQARQLLLKAAKDVEEGKRPMGSDPAVYRNVRACDRIIPKDINWKEGIKDGLVSIF